VETEPQIISSFIATGKARLVYRHLLQLGEQTARASEASECAADQGQFWKMRFSLYRRQSELYQSGDLEATLADLAGDIGLDTQQFGACMAKSPHRSEIEADYQAAQAEGIRTRPAFIINGRRLVGALPFEQFQQAIEGR